MKPLDFQAGDRVTVEHGTRSAAYVEVCPDNSDFAIVESHDGTQYVSHRDYLRPAPADMEAA